MDNNLNSFTSDVQKFIEDVDQQVFDAILLFFLSSVILLFIKNRIVSGFSYLTRKDESSIENIVIKEVKLFPNIIVFFISLYIAYSSLKNEISNETVVQIIDIVFFATIGFYLIQLVAKIIRRISSKAIENAQDSTTKSIYHYISNISLSLLWVLAIVFVISNLGYDVSALVAGLGISGFAIAFGIRKIIFDMISSAVIVLEKPFKIGDYIVIKDSKQGIVKHIGIRSIRLQVSDKSEIVISNGEVVSKAITNYKNLKRSEFNFEIEIKNESIDDINIVKLLRKDLTTNATEVILDAFIFVKEYTEETSKVRIDVSAKVGNDLAAESIEIIQKLIIDTLKKYEVSYSSINTSYEKVT